MASSPDPGFPTPAQGVHAPERSSRQPPLVSVVIPVYNGAAFVAEAIGSVRTQGFQDFEIIVIDDGSTDPTAEVLDRLSPAPTRIYQPHGGPSKARNAGVRASRGKYIAFLDADDLWLPDRLALQVRLLENDPELGLVFSDMSRFNETGTLEPSSLSRKGWRRCHRKIVREQRRLKNPFEMLLRRNFICTSTVLVRRSCLDQAGGFDERLSHAEDLDLWMQLSLSTGIGAVPRVLVLKRDHASNISKDDRAATRSALLLVDNWLTTRPEVCRRYRTRFAVRLARLHGVKGYSAFAGKDYAAARSSYWMSLRHRPTVRALVYFIASHLPPATIDSIRHLKARAGL